MKEKTFAKGGYQITDKNVKILCWKGNKEGKNKNKARNVDIRLCVKHSEHDVRSCIFVVMWPFFYIYTLIYYIIYF